MRYQQIQSRIWHDDKFISLTPLQQRLFFYILTCPHGNLIGLFVLKTGYACEDLKSFGKDFAKDLRSLCEKGLISYDNQFHVVWIKNFLKYNPLTNPNQKKAAIRHLLDLPKSYLIQEFMKYTEGLTEGLTKDLPKDFAKDLRSPFYTDTGPGPDTGPEKEKEEKEEKEEKGVSLVSEIISILNSVCKTHYKPDSKKSTELIKARIKEGFTVEDFRTVIEKKHAEWSQDEKMSAFLRPETLFGNKFEGYLNQITAKKKSITDIFREIDKEERDDEARDTKDIIIPTYSISPDG